MFSSIFGSNQNVHHQETAFLRLLRSPLSVMLPFIPLLLKYSMDFFFFRMTHSRDAALVIIGLIAGPSSSLS